jgi:hypothetical protein
MSGKRGKGSVGGGEAGKKAKTTPDAGEKSVSEKKRMFFSLSPTLSIDHPFLS